MDQIITEGIDGRVCLIGFPYDVGARRSGIPQGQEYGPDCLRRFFPLVGALVNDEL